MNEFSIRTPICSWHLSAFTVKLKSIEIVIERIHQSHHRHGCHLSRNQTCLFAWCLFTFQTLVLISLTVLDSQVFVAYFVVSNVMALGAASINNNYYGYNFTVCGDIYTIKSVHFNLKRSSIEKEPMFARSPRRLVANNILGNIICMENGRNVFGCVSPVFENAKRSNTIATVVIQCELVISNQNISSN